MSNDGIVIVLDFTDTTEAAPREKLMHSHRSTTSSRHPGRAIEGTVAAFHRRVVTCPDCGGKRMDFDGPHGPQVIGHDRVRDCIGRIWCKGEIVK